MVYVVTRPVADLHHLMRRITRFRLSLTDNSSLMLPLWQATPES